MSSTKSAQAPLPHFTVLDYTKFFAAGAFCCSATHAAMTPVDVIKTRIQIDPTLSKMGMMSAGRSIVAAEGAKGLLTGLAPTAVGYLVQGGAKFAGYEFWKKQFVELAGGPQAAVPHRTAIYLAGAGVAEFFADVLLTPLEATRIRLVSDRTYASGLAPAFLRMAKEGGFKEMYAGFIPIICKQIPYAVGQFTIFELCQEAVATKISPETRAKLSTLQETGITLGCGIVAGIGASLLSQPADTLLSKINKEGAGKGGIVPRLWSLAKTTGARGLFAGTGPRMLMTTGFVSGQFLIYAEVTKALRAPAGVKIIG